MSMDATMQIRMSSELKAQVEELYHELGTSFAEAVRIFAYEWEVSGQARAEKDAELCEGRGCGHCRINQQVCQEYS